jgi:hypothetical protein
MAASTKKPAEGDVGTQPAPVTQAGKTTPPTETTTPTPTAPDPAQPGAGPTPATGSNGDETAGNPNRVGEGNRPAEPGKAKASSDSVPSAVAAMPTITPIVPNPRQKMIDALMEEREGYTRLKDTHVWERFEHRVTAVDESLKAFGTSYDEQVRYRKERADRQSRGEREPGTADPNRKMIEALLDEREGYVQRRDEAERNDDEAGVTDAQQRVEAVDESLQRLGTDHETAAAERSGRQQRDQQPSSPTSSRGQQTR